jgi:phenol/toluene 2-monooxygenase (NADH) P1/A1
VVKIAAANSAENKQLIEQWIGQYVGIASDALEPVAALAFGADAKVVMAERRTAFAAKLGKLGLSVSVEA